MAKFDWVPYLEGKYLNYYQWFAFIGCFVMLVLSLLSAILYLILCKIAAVNPRARSQASKKLIDRLKNITFNGTFISLTIIPLICSALDVINLVEGMLGMMMVSTIQIFLDNGRKQWNEDEQFNYRMPTLKAYLTLCLRLSP
jgi:hypothetical protein